MRHRGMMEQGRNLGKRLRREGKFDENRDPLPNLIVIDPAVAERGRPEENRTELDVVAVVEQDP